MDLEAVFVARLVRTQLTLVHLGVFPAVYESMIGERLGSVEATLADVTHTRPETETQEAVSFLLNNNTTNTPTYR